VGIEGEDSGILSPFQAPGEIMTKANIAERIAEHLSFTKKESEEIIELVLEMMKRVLVAEGKLKIAGFGNFEVKRKKDRKGRNPQTGEELTITARKNLTYHPSVILKNKLNRIVKSE
jgi:integration host factor subunit alpha